MPIVITLGLVFGGTSLLFGASSFVSATVRGELDKKSRQYLLDIVNRLNDQQSKIVSQLNVVFHEIQWTQLIVQANDAVQNINYQYSRMQEFSAGENASAVEWANHVMDKNSGIEKDLFVIHELMMGRSLLSGPLMKVYINKLIKSSTTQSKNHDAILYFRAIINLQHKGLLVLGNAKRVLNAQADVKSFIEPLANRFQMQVDYNSQFIYPLDRKYHDTEWAGHYFDANVYVDLHKNVAPNNHLVVGLQLYKKGNRVGIRINTAPVDSHGEIESQSAKWQDSPGWGEGSEDYFTLNESNGQTYFDTNMVVVPDGRVVTGIQMYKKGNRMAIKLQSAIINPLTGVIDNSSKDWHLSPGWGDAYIDIRPISRWYVHNNRLQPSPMSYITGAALFKHGNRLAFEVVTDFYKLQ